MAAAKMSSGEQDPAVPPNDGGGLTEAICFPLTDKSHSIPPRQEAEPSKFMSGIKISLNEERIEDGFNVYELLTLRFSHSFSQFKKNLGNMIE
jgi:hypothetical protein